MVPVPGSPTWTARSASTASRSASSSISTPNSETGCASSADPAPDPAAHHLSTGILNTPPGVLEGLQLIVSDIETARTELVERDVEASPVQHMEDGDWVEGRGGDWNSFVFFSDPDGNGWVLQACPASDDAAPQRTSRGGESDRHSAASPGSHRRAGRVRGREGLHVAVYRDGEQVVDAVAGIADPATGRPVTSDTPFFSYSIGKGVPPRWSTCSPSAASSTTTP